MKRTWQRMVKLAVLIALISGLVSCGDPASGPGKSAVFLVAEGDGLYGILSDVYNPALPGKVASDYVKIKMKTIAKDQSENAALNVYSDVVVEEYRVSYYRADGNPRVPAPITVPCHAPVSLGEGGFIQALVITRDAKLQSPLKDLVFGGGEGTIIMTAVIDFYGKDYSGNAVTTSYKLFIQAGDFNAGDAPSS